METGIYKYTKYFKRLSFTILFFSRELLDDFILYHLARARDYFAGFIESQSINYNILFLMNLKQKRVHLILILSRDFIILLI